MSTTSLNDFQASNSEELSFSVHWLPSNSFLISDPTSSPFFSMVSLLQSPSFFFKYINGAPSLFIALTKVFISPSLLHSGVKGHFLDLPELCVC